MCHAFRPINTAPERGSCRRGRRPRAFFSRRLLSNKNSIDKSTIKEWTVESRRDLRRRLGREGSAESSKTRAATGLKSLKSPRHHALRNRFLPIKYRKGKAMFANYCRHCLSHWLVVTIREFGDNLMQIFIHSVSRQIAQGATAREWKHVIRVCRDI